MLRYAAQAALYLKKQKSLAERRRESRKLKRGDYKKEIVSIPTEQAVRELEKIRPYHHTDCVPMTFSGRCAVSVIIPVYNAAATLEKCLDSVCEQVLEQTFEVICVNDGSTDGSADILRAYAEKYPFLVFIEQENCGGAGARNRGLKEAEGEYLFFLDADDFLPEGTLRKLLKDARTSGADIVIGKTGKYLTKYEVAIYPRAEKSREETSLWETRKYGMGTPWGKLYKASLWQNVQFFEGDAFEDSIVYLDIYPQCRKFYLEGTPSYCFRSGQNNSLFKRQKKSARGIDALWIIIKGVQCARKLGVEIHNSEYYQLVLWHLSAVMYGRLKQFESEELLKNAFVVAAEFVCEEFAGRADYGFVDKDKEIYRLLEKSFRERDFGTWVQCSKAL